MKESLKKNFIDEKGTDCTMIIEGTTIPQNQNKKFKLHHEFAKSPKKPKGVFTSDIGIHSSGFAGIVGLATILSIAGIIIAYLFWKF